MKSPFLIILLLTAAVWAQVDVTQDQPDSLLVYNWMDGTWQPVSKEVYTFTAFGEPTDTIRSVFYLNEWRQDWWTQVSYDGNGIRTQVQRLQGTDEGWDDHWRWNYAYNESGQLTSSIYSFSQDNIWNDGERLLYTYDTVGRLADEITQASVLDSWYNDTRRLMIYNGDQLEQIMHQTWHFDNGIWLDQEREQFSYDAQGIRTTWTYQVLENQEWVNRDQLLWTYDGNGQLLTETSRWWSSSEWLNVHRLVFEINPMAVLISITTQKWNYDDTYWYDDYQETYRYDEAGRQTEIAGTYWDADSLNWQNEVRSTWYYPATSSIDPIQPRRFTLEQNFPNPFNPSTTIRFSLEESSHVDLAIFDIQGRKLIELVNETLSAGTHHEEWNGLDQEMKQLETGIYLARLTSESHFQTIKMLLLR